jgi:predicted enzyme related to lactoylglutathione lyase
MPVVAAEGVRPPEGVPSRDTPEPMGCISWLDLTVSDASATRDFYRQVVGWSVQDVEMEDASERYADYNMVCDDGNPAAGICHARGVNLGLPPIWLIYLPVGDLAESLRRVREGGGKIIKETTGADGRDAYAVVEDPVGATLALVPG